MASYLGSATLPSEEVSEIVAPAVPSAPGWGHSLDEAAPVLLAGGAVLAAAAGADAWLRRHFRATPESPQMDEMVDYVLQAMGERELDERVEREVRRRASRRRAHGKRSSQRTKAARPSADQ